MRRRLVGWLAVFEVCQLKLDHLMPKSVAFALIIRFQAINGNVFVSNYTV